MNDNNTTIEQLKLLVTTFVEERNWQQYHTPKNLSINIAVEAAELMEIFNWTNDQNSYHMLETKREHVSQEIADIAFTLLNFCARNNIDLTSAFKAKMILNAQKYPVEKSKDRIEKYTEL